MSDKPTYFPFIDQKRYTTDIGMVPLDKCDFHNGPIDKQVIQITEDYEQDIDSKDIIGIKGQTKGKGVPLDSRFSSIDHLAAYEHLLKVLEWEHPKVFDQLPQDTYRQYFNQFIRRIPEEVAVWSLDGETNWMSYCLICNPHGWNPIDKIGKSFYGVHKDVPNFPITQENQQKFVKHLTKAGPFVRFVWGFTFNEFDPKHSWLWVERQTTHPLIEDRCFLFLIRNYSYPVYELKGTPLLSLHTALTHMSKEEIEYKGGVEWHRNVRKLLSKIGAS